MSEENIRKHVVDNHVEVPEEVVEIDFKPRLLRMIYNQPTILYYILEVLFEILETRELLSEEEAKSLISEAMRRWRDEGGEIK